jgi:hypothetical protein
MRVLLVLRHAELVRNFEAVLRELSARGHELHVALELKRKRFELLEDLAREYPTLTYGFAPGRRDAWEPLATTLRRTIDYLRYHEPRYRDARRLRSRARRGTAAWVLGLAERGLLDRPRLRRVLDQALRAVDRCVPVADRIERFVASQRADVLVVSPLVDGVAQPDYVRAGQALGIPTALAVASWDNLTNKGLVRDAPQRVYVWNADQVREAVELHGIPIERVRAVGGHTYDHWFAWRPTRGRRSFCRDAGLDPERPFLLYLCSSNFIGSHSRGTVEADFVARWLHAIRAHGGPRVRSAGVLIRPHPMAAAPWAEHPVAEEPGVAVLPRAGADPTTVDAKREYYDSLHHAACVVGLNTSALIEAAIVGRASYTVLAPEYRDQQAGTLHFHLLARADGGLLTTAASFAEHAAQLEAALERGGDQERTRAFVAGFIRPAGLDSPCAPLLADSLEEFAGVPVQQARRGLGQRAGAALLAPLARRYSARWVRPGAELKPSRPPRTPAGRR